MNTFLADLHIHTVLSPCGDLEMSPANIVDAAVQKHLDIIGVSDHNSTRHGPLIKKLAAKKGIFVLCGAEVTTAEEVHCLAFMPDMESLNALQDYLDKHLPDIENDPDKFGYQVQVDEDEMIVYEERKLLISAIDQNINQVEAFVHRHGGLFIPAHINRAAFGLINQLGFVPPDLNYDALELSRHITIGKFCKEQAYLKSATFIQSSDAHFPRHVGQAYSRLLMPEPSFENIRSALHQKNDCRVIQQSPI